MNEHNVTSFVILDTRMKREPSGHTRREYLTRCHCGAERWRSAQHVKTGASTQCKSCGTKTHGNSGTREYAAWYAMVHRCTRPESQWYRRYGGRGITVCERWLIFDNFLADMGPCPPGLTIERRENNEGYHPGNCYWATRAEQSANRSSCVLLTYDGVTLHASEWARRQGLHVGLILGRIHHGWTVERALTTYPKARK